MTGARVFFYVQHLLGIGHLRRAATIARALTGAGLDVTVVSGGSGIPSPPADVERGGSASGLRGWKSILTPRINPR